MTEHTLGPVTAGYLIAERDRLREINAELVAALEQIAAAASDYEAGQRMNPDDTQGVLTTARAALAKARSA